VDAVLARALSKSGRRRFRSVAEFSAAFKEAAMAWGRANQPPPAAVAATDSGAHDVARKRRSRRRSGRVALGAAALGMAVFFVAERGPSRAVPVAQPIVHDEPPRGAPAAPAEPPVMQATDEPQADVFTATAPPRERADSEGSSEVRTRRPARIRAAAGERTTRPRSALSVDEDATMPPTMIEAQNLQP
jgi:hypothetical protein